MVNIFCTRKLETFVDIKEKPETNPENDNNWNGHLISIGGRKCLYFVEKKTLYSILLIDILKKDLKQLEKLFFNELLIQLQEDKIYKPEYGKYLIENYSSLRLFQTDNDQKTMGTMRDDIGHLKAYCEDKNDKLKAATEFAHRSLNRIPIGTRKYKYAKEIMEEMLKTTSHNSN
ncbi:MAG TPA: hypothetical protein VFF35_06795 [Bacteroidia bacterium]|nr:hypothetical protein [Bacteroidia bacterium]